MSISIECTKCRGMMERGFLLDNSDYDIKQVGRWVAGEPEKKSEWLGGGVKIKERKVLAVSTYRCTACGYLESYAK